MIDALLILPAFAAVVVQRLVLLAGTDEIIGNPTVVGPVSRETDCNNRTMLEDMSTIDEVAVVTSFNDAINARDLDRLGSLMTDAHRFVDSAGGTIDGKVACLDAWRGFFAAFPDYRNVFEEFRRTGEGLVFVRGRSVCSVAELDGPAEWHVVVRDSRVDQWQVSEPA